MINTSLGATAHQYESMSHPRLFLNASDITSLRERAKSGDTRTIMRAVRKRVAAAVSRVQEAQDLPAEILEREGGSLIGLLPEIALVGVLDADERTIRSARDLLLACPAGQRRGPAGRTNISYGGANFHAGAYDLVQPHMTAAEQQRFCKWAHEHCVKRVLHSLLPSYCLRAGGNIPMVGMLNALQMILAIKGEPGVPDLDKLQAEAITMFEATLNVVVGPDGYPEEDMGYGTLMTGRCFQVVAALRRSGLFDAYRNCPHILRFGQAVLHVMQPWGGALSITGDHGYDFGVRELALAMIAEETNDPSMLWLSGHLPYFRTNEIPLRKGVVAPAAFFSLLTVADLKKATHPRQCGLPTAFRERGRGLVSFRSGWKADDTFVTFDGSQRNPAAQGHAHASCGHFSISALGEYLAIDTGRYNIEQSCHNIVLINGKSGRSTDVEWIATKYPGRLIDYAPGKFVDYAAVDSSHQHNCYWAQRHLGLVKGPAKHGPAYAWVVDDINHADDWTEFWWQLQTAPENTIKTTKASATIIGSTHGNLLDVHFALPAARNFPKPHKIVEISQDIGIPSSTKYVGDLDERAAKHDPPNEQMRWGAFKRPRLLVKIAGYNGRFMAIMLPREKARKKATVKRLATIPGSLAVSVGRDDVEDVIIFAFEHNILEAEGISERGRWCVIRRSLSTGKVLRRQIGEPRRG